MNEKRNKISDFLSWFVTYWMVCITFNMITQMLFALSFWWLILSGIIIGGISFAITVTILKPVTTRIYNWIERGRDNVLA